MGKTKNRKNVSVHVERIQGQIVRAAIRRPTAVDDEMQISYLFRTIPATHKALRVKRQQIGRNGSAISGPSGCSIQ